VGFFFLGYLYRNIQSENMLSERVYQRTSEEFGTPVGVARITGYKKKSEHIDEVTPEVYKRLSHEMDINWIISETILDGNYKELQREVYNLKRTNKRLKSELSIYKRAFQNINGKGNTNITKPSKVHTA
jgi:DNA integrity scanning protein DisA with diadenylate cyclase activity